MYTGEVVLGTEGKDTLDTTQLFYYTEHPSNVKTFFIESFPMEELEQKEPFEIKALCGEFQSDVGSAYNKYLDKRFEVTGVVKTVGPDVHNKPSIELTDKDGRECYALCIFPERYHPNDILSGTPSFSWHEESHVYGCVIVQKIESKYNMMIPSVFQFLFKRRVSI